MLCSVYDCLLQFLYYTLYLSVGLRLLFTFAALSSSHISWRRYIRCHRLSAVWLGLSVPFVVIAGAYADRSNVLYASYTS